jgi:hypothetical protein
MEPMRLFKPVFLAYCCAAAAFAQSSAAPRIAAHIRAEDLKADVAFLASDALQGRATPSPGLDAAAEYIASQFRKAGLEPAGDDNFFQTASFQVITPVLEGFEISSGTARLTTGIVQDPVALDLKDVAVVKATSADIANLTVDQVRGKVLVLDLSAGRGARLSSIAALEPAAAILLPPANRVLGMASRPVLRDLSAPPSKMAALLVTDAAMREALLTADATVSIHLAAPKTEIAKARNVAGLLRGSDPILKDTYLIVTGHYDHLGVRQTGDGDRIFNGANDDASGTSSVVEIGAALAALSERPRRSILFLALFGEEAGLFGSRYYTSHPIFPFNQTVADVNLEHMGRTDDSEGPRLATFNLTGFDYTDIANTMLKAGAETGITVVKHEKNSDAFYGSSDNAAFAAAGVPATTISVTYIFPDYHAVGDEWPKLDYLNMAHVDQCIALGLWTMANSDKAPEWNRDNPKTKAYVEAWDKITTHR